MITHESQSKLLGDSSKELLSARADVGDKVLIGTMSVIFIGIVGTVFAAALGFIE